MLRNRSFIVHLLATLLVAIISAISGFGIGSEAAYAIPPTTPTALATSTPTSTPLPTATPDPAVVSAEINMDSSVNVAPEKNLFLQQ